MTVLGADLGMVAPGGVGDYGGLLLGQGARYHPGHVWEHHGAWDIETGMRFQIKLFSAEYVICCRWATAACVRVWPSGCWSCSSTAGSASIQVSCFQSLTDILMYYSSPPCWHKDMASHTQVIMSCLTNCRCTGQVIRMTLQKDWICLWDCFFLLN